MLVYGFVTDGVHKRTKKKLPEIGSFSSISEIILFSSWLWHCHLFLFFRFLFWLNT
jgi:hypothetical protein